MSDSPGIVHFASGLVTGQEIFHMSSLSSWVYNGLVLQPWGYKQYLSLLLYRPLYLAYVSLVALSFPSFQIASWEWELTLKKTQSGKTKLFGYYTHAGKILRFFICCTKEEVEEDEEKYKECIYSQMYRHSPAGWGLLIAAYCNIPQYFSMLPSPALRYWQLFCEFEFHERSILKSAIWSFLDCRNYVRNILWGISEHTQQDWGGKKTADPVWQTWQFCLKKTFR